MEGKDDASVAAVIRWAVQGEVALEAIRGLTTVSEFAALHKVHPTPITLRMEQLQVGGEYGVRIGNGAEGGQHRAEFGGAVRANRSLDDRAGLGQ